MCQVIINAMEKNETGKGSGMLGKVLRGFYFNFKKKSQKGPIEKMTFEQNMKKTRA